MYVAELMKATKKIHEGARKAQDEHAERKRERSMARAVPSMIVGAMVLLERPPKEIGVRVRIFPSQMFCNHRLEQNYIEL